MTASDHLRITGPEDILGFIPHSLGYWPENSLVAMTMQGKRLGATLRVDLPDPEGASGTCRNGSGRGDPAAGRARAVAKRRPGSGPRDTFAGFARHVVSYLQADEAADGSLLAFFTDADSISVGVNGAPTDPDNAGEGPRTVWAGLLKELELALQAAGMPLRDAWIIGTEFWQNAYCSDPECCGPLGRPVEQIRNSRLNAEMVFRGSMVGAAPDARASAPVATSVDPAVHAAESGWMTQFSPRQRDRSQFAQVLDIWTLVLRTVEDPERPLGLRPEAPAPETGTRAPGTISAGSPDAKTGDWPFKLPPELAGYLRASLCIPPWRDALLVMAAAGRPAAERGAEDFGIFEADCGPGALAVSRPGPTPSPIPGSAAGTLSSSMSGTLSAAPGPTSAAAGPGLRPGPRPGAEAVPGYGEVLLGLAPSIPDWALMVRLERVLELLAALGEGEPTAAAATARGWIEWCRGRGSYADALYRQALEGHPGYRLAELLAELGRRGTLCGWAARREAAWQKFAPDAA
ncbi:DUF4192 family protein [Arthrobacter oryzae]|uniref:Uncharacterized protein DUF4192 n=1 Tax=Arthrobacter oryzae TaxID=409290 RepID=A0A495EAA7_9MICC|nr:DUF4192 family protein [Arthrobacter oryzae]RKR13854.1 uncharacterized protein DUF4192 [Arthrobacter oryzae]